MVTHGNILSLFPLFAYSPLLSLPFSPFSTEVGSQGLCAELRASPALLCLPLSVLSQGAQAGPGLGVLLAQPPE